MIDFSCGNCNHRIGAPEKYAGKRVRCPKCQEPTRVPESVAEAPAQKPSIIKFRCPGCNQKIGLSPKYAGKRVKCAKCEKVLRVPQPAGKSTQPDVKEDTEPSVTAQQEQSTSDDLWAGLENMEALLSAEAQAPSLEMPDRPPVPEYGTGESEFAQFPGQFSQGESFPGGGDTRGTSNKKYLIIIIASISALVVLVMGIVVWSSFGKPDPGEDQRQLMLPEVQDFAEKYIRSLESGEIEKAAELLSPSLKENVKKDQIEEFSKLIGDSNIVSLECIMKQSQERLEGSQFILLYNLFYDQSQQAVVVSVLESDGTFWIDGIAAHEPFGTSVSIGPKSYEELSMAIVGEKLKDFGAIAAKILCPLAVVFLILGLIQIVSMWIVFEKAGQPGWAILVPFYSAWVMAEIGDKPGWFGLLACAVNLIPYIGPILQLVLWIMIAVGIAKTFKRGVGFGVGLSLLPFIFFPILAFTGD